MPTRVQMSRQHPWRHEHPDAVRCDRSTSWGNPYRVIRTRASLDGMVVWRVVDQNGWPVTLVRSDYATKDEALDAAVDCFEKANGSWPAWMPNATRELKGRDLACWCSLDRRCHVDVIGRLVNGAAWRS